VAGYGRGRGVEARRQEARIAVGRATKTGTTGGGSWREKEVRLARRSHRGDVRLARAATKSTAESSSRAGDRGGVALEELVELGRRGGERRSLVVGNVLSKRGTFD
jgi:hypothetical protein